jgi:hypothetical protein
MTILTQYIQEPGTHLEQAQEAQGTGHTNAGILRGAALKGHIVAGWGP